MSRRKRRPLTGCRHIRKLFGGLCERQMRKAEFSFHSVALNFHFLYVTQNLTGSDNTRKRKCKMWSFRYYAYSNHIDVKFTIGIEFEMKFEEINEKSFFQFISSYMSFCGCMVLNFWTLNSFVRENWNCYLYHHFC